MGCCMEAMCLHTLKRCGCCICDCCYGSSSKKCYCTLHETEYGQTVFNSPFSLILYDKWSKESDVYKNKEGIFEQLSETVITNKNLVQDLVILDIGCGTGCFTTSLANTFMADNNDTLICMDISPQCLHFVRTRVVEQNAMLRSKHIEYFNNDTNSLCLENYYNDNNIDIIFMAFVLNHISVGKGDRHCILKQLYSVCKNDGAFIVFEYGTQFLQQFNEPINSSGSDKDGDGAVLLENAPNDTTMSGFNGCDELQQYVEGFGFKFEKRIMEETFGNQQWILLFRK